MFHLKGYQIIQKLGKQHQRKFGDVYLVIKEETNERFILKHNQKNQINSKQIDQLRSEQQFSFTTNGLPTVVDFKETETELYLVKKYQEGIPLDDFWLTTKRKERIQFLKLFLEKLQNLLFEIHMKNIFHCDLKPSNILINGTVNNFEVELIDFGLAIQQPIDNERSLMFPLGYAAPELILNQLHLVNPTTDYFSLGIILWKLYCEALPLSHPNPSIYTNLQLTYPIQDHSRLPKGLLEIILKLTVKPVFKSIPSKLSKLEIEESLKMAQAKRVQSLEEVKTSISALKEKRFWNLF